MRASQFYIRWARNLLMLSKPFSRYFLFCKANKVFITSFTWLICCFVHWNVADDVFFQMHFTDLYYLDSFLRYSFVKVGICKHEPWFACHGYCSITLITAWENLHLCIVTDCRLQIDWKPAVVFLICKPQQGSFSPLKEIRKIKQSVFETLITNL